jgi:hypothetical protein
VRYPAFQIRFGAISSLDRRRPGLYEIHSDAGVALKVGIGADVRKRLFKHARSLQSRLILKPGGSWDNPRDVVSKASILAKHLYFDRDLRTSCDLTTEPGRQQFLHQDCFVIVEYADNREELLVEERHREMSNAFRYTGPVIVRPSRT